MERQPAYRRQVLDLHGGECTQCWAGECGYKGGWHGVDGPSVHLYGDRTDRSTCLSAGARLSRVYASALSI
jgi:hypothetical protein